MIQKGQIETIISPYQYKVRIPRYDKLSTTPGGIPTEDLSSAIVCSVPGTRITFAEGDIVLIDFENNELNKPVILGLLYREDIGEEDQFTSPLIEKALSKINKQLDILNNQQSYVHIKYSNDNGLTFTSLYEYSDVVTEEIGQNTYKSAHDIALDPKSSSIYWSIIDSNNQDVTSNFDIITTLRSDNLSETFYDSLIEIPLRLKGLNKLELDFSILNVPNFDDYHVVLTTDKNTLGSVYGDYMGICVSTDAVAPLDPNSYSWTSFNETIKNLLLSLESNLLPRVEKNEEALYGYNKSKTGNITDGTGLIDAINVSVDRIDIHGADNKDIIFNTSESIYIDNKENAFITEEVEYTNNISNVVFSEEHTLDNHLSLTLRKKE